MPANLTPQYLSAEERYKQAHDDREKLKALKEMLGVIPKHKGTEKLQADIKRKIAHLKDDLEAGKSKTGTRRFSYKVEKEGAGQIAIVGPPNAGKTQLVNALTNASFEIGDYPFTTRIFQPAMMPYEDIQIQLIDLPPFSEEYLENWVPSIVKGSDAMLLVLDLSNDDLLNQIEATLNLLNKHKIEFINHELSVGDARWTFLKSLVVCNKMDQPQSQKNFKVFKEFYNDKFSCCPVSANDVTSLKLLKIKIVELLDIIRVYSKRPGHEPEINRPFVFPRNSTILDFAKAVHKDFAEQLKFARVWGHTKFDGQRITRDYILEDKDIIELHI